MAKIIVIYDSKTGNTEKMAHAVAEGAGEVLGPNVILKRADETELQLLLEADGIIIGSPTYYGLMSAKVKALLDKSIDIHGKLEGKVGAAFTSSGGIASGAETALLSIIEALLIHGMIVQGRSEDKPYGEATVESPDATALERCRALGRRTANLVLKLKN